MKPIVIEVPLRRTIDEGYPITIGWGLTSRVLEALSAAPLADLSLVIITDESVAGLWAEAMRDELGRNDRSALLLSVPAGERSKTRHMKEVLEDEMIAAGCGRDTCILAIGGGVITDLAGFVAATYTRGIPFINCPTTVLAAADASVGGKTGIDTDVATNLIGSFHQPTAVFIDLAAWATLPAAEVRNGLAETVKHGCIADAELFAYLEQVFVTGKRDVLEAISDRPFCERIAVRNCEIKKSFVAEDVHEANACMILNMGHTYGRALEAASDYSIAHGEAVAIGLCLQAELGLARGYVTQTDLDRLRALLEAIGLPTRRPGSIAPDLLVEKTLKDKKVRGGVVRFVFQRGIGDYVRFDDGEVSTPVSEAELLDHLAGSTPS